MTDATEETVDDAGGKVGVKRGGGCRPDACAHENGLEEEGDRQAAKKAGEGNDDKTAGSDGEEVANNGALHCGGRQMPLAKEVEQLVAPNSRDSKQCMEHIQ